MLRERGEGDRKRGGRQGSSPLTVHSSLSPILQAKGGREKRLGKESGKLIVTRAEEKTGSTDVMKEKDQTSFATLGALRAHSVIKLEYSNHKLFFLFPRRGKAQSGPFTEHLRHKVIEMGCNFPKSQQDITTKSTNKQPGGAPSFDLQQIYIHQRNVVKLLKKKHLT